MYIVLWHFLIMFDSFCFALLTILQRWAMNQTINYRTACSLMVFVCLVGWFWFFKTGSLCVALAVLDALQARLVLNSQRSTCLCLPNVGIKGVHQHSPAGFLKVGKGTLTLFSHRNTYFILRRERFLTYSDLALG